MLVLIKKEWEDVLRGGREKEKLESEEVFVIREGMAGVKGREGRRGGGA